MDTHGWDVVFAADVAVVNAALAKSTGALVSTFSFESPDAAASGQFGEWSIVPGGAGRLLFLKVAIQSGRLIVGSGDPLDLSGAAVVLEVPLRWQPLPSGGAGKTLRFDFHQAPDTAGASSAAAVTVARVIAPPGRLTPLQQALVGQAVAACMAEHADDIAFVLATVVPPAAASAGWLESVGSDYYYAAPAGRTALLAILGMTAGGHAGMPEPKIDTNLLDGKENAAVAISPALFMRHVFVPVLAQSLHAASTSFTTGADAVVRNHGQIDLPAVTVALVSYYPIVTSCTARIMDDQVIVDLSGTCAVALGISMNFAATSRIATKLDSASRLQFPLKGAPTFSYNMNVSIFDRVVVGLLGNVILELVTAAIGSALAGGIQQAAKTLEITKSAPAVVRWAGFDGFAPTQAGLATTLYVRGNVLPA